MYSALRHTVSIFWKRRPVQLTFFVTRRCNARCPFCFYLASDDTGGDWQDELSLHEIGKISGSLGKLLWLAFSGGEIFLRKDLVEISQIFYAQNQPVMMLYPTNGLLPERIRDTMEEILKQCANSVVAVKISLDGVGETHDTLRKTPDGFDKAMNTYHLLEPLLDNYPNFELGINTVFCADNQDTMDEIIDFVGALNNVGTHTISMVRGNLSDEHYKQIDHRKYDRAIVRLEENLKNRTANVYRFRGARLKAAQDILQRRLIHETILQKKRETPCYAGRLNLVLTETGDVYPCEILTTSFGNIRDYDYDMRKIIRSRRAKEVIDPILEKQCHCTHECNFIMNILFNPGLYPPLLKEYVQL